ncbi:hypothetical protein [Mesorhizobium sp.]|uniref:hypothetical protein n=1 Tax=Mesorhizobium sp. TaxID=1871066 RepID=UPI0025C6BDA0|nr:hypothetical protein [Mesorhizobium sp.]
MSTSDTAPLRKATLPAHLPVRLSDALSSDVVPVAISDMPIPPIPSRRHHSGKGMGMAKAAEGRENLGKCLIAAVNQLDAALALR